MLNHKRLTQRWWARIPTSAAIILCCTALPAPAQPAPAATQPTESLISLNFPENVDLKTLVDYVSQRLNLNLIYQDDQLTNQRVTLKSPTRIPASALLGLLKELLKVKGFAMVDADQPGWIRIVALQASAVPATQPASGDTVVTQAFALRFIDPQRAEQAVKPFLSGPTAGTLGIPEQHILLVTDFASTLQRVEQVLAVIDQPNKNVRVGFIPVKNADASQLGQQVKQILQARIRAQLLPGQNPDNSIEVTQDRRTGQLVVVGPVALVDEAAEVVKSLDVPVNEQQSPIRFYKLANTTASDVLDTIRALEGESGSGEAAKAQAPAAATPAPAASPAAGGIQNGFGATGLAGGGFAGTGGGSTLANPYGTGGAPFGATPPGLSPQIGGQAGQTATSSTPAPAGLRTHNATVAADPNTNSIIVIAEPSVQKMYEQLVKALDKRRPQVLLEATIVTIDTTHDLTFGVEVAGRSKPGNTQAVTFTSFGFSTPNASTGQLTLTPGTGFNGVVIGSDLAQVIIRALATNSRAKVTSSPRILVNDNATGTLSSLTEQPYTQTAIGTTIATTSFGGYAQAGTVVTLTPHISEADYLQLEYQVTLSSFIGGGSTTNGIPPGIVQDAVQSKVTIPDGSTVVVGGLNQSNFSKAVSSVPIIDQIPILNFLIGRHDDLFSKSTLFVFLRPIILRDDQFEDLKFLSERDILAAELPAGMPSSHPLAIP